IPYFERDQVPPQANSVPQNRSQLQPSAKTNGDGSRPNIPSLNGGQQIAMSMKKSTQPLPERQSSLSESDSAIVRTATTASTSNSSTSLQGGNNGGCESTCIDSDSDVDGAEGGSSDVDDDDDNLDEEGDEDEDFDSGSSSHESLRDSFWDALLKEPKLRTPADIEVLVENVQKLPAFSNLSEGTRAALCRLMLVAVVREAGQVVLSDNEILDTWSVILNGTVEVIDPDGTIRELSSGDSFGVRLPPPGSPPSAATLVQKHRGQMRTVTEDCQFVCVAQTDYFRVMARAADAEVPETEEGDSGRVVLVYEDIRKEAGQSSDGGTTSPLPSSLPSTQISRVVIKGTPDKLIEHLKSPEPSDQSYAEDLLLTYRTFLPTPALLVRRLLSWWDEALPGTPTDQRLIRARIQRYVVLWVHNHPGDFHDRPAMLRFLETFSDLLQRDNGNRRLLHLALSTRARPRTVPVNLTLVVTPTSTSTTCHIVLPCVLVGGQGEFGVFVNQAEEIDYGPTGGYEIRAGLRRGDQLLVLQNRGVEGASLAQLASTIASLVLMSNRQPPGSTVTKTLAFTILYNPSQFYELMSKVGELNSRLTSKNRATVISTRGKQVHAFEVASIQEALSLINSSSRGAIGALPTNNVNKWMDQQQQQGHIQQLQPIPGKQLIRGGASLRYSPGTPQLRPSIATNKPSMISAEAPSPSSNPSSSELTRSSSQPDLTGVIGGSKSDQSRGSFSTSGWSDSSGSGGGNSGISVIRVWRSLGGEPKDQVSKLVALYPRTIARTAVRLAAQEFNIDHPEDAASEFCLCLVTVDEGPIMKQSRIADSMDDLANRIALNSRYYLKQNRVHDVLITDEVAKVIYNESKVSLTQLSPEEVAIQLTLDDFSVFRSIESAEFVDKVFGLTSSTQDNPDVGSNATATNSSTENIAGEPSIETRKGFPTGCANLDAFADLVNKEAYWVPSEICAETNLQKRVDMLKRFIKIAKLCKDLRNFNTMFCILVGLHMSPVERLRQTWERLPNKYVKMSRDLALVLDPSRNFAHYRNLLNSSPQSSPMTSPSQSGAHCLPLVPYLPLVLKDLTFIHLGNPSRTPASNTSSPQLINFAKLRMFAKEIRSLRRMCDIDYDLPLAQRLLQSSGNSNKFAFLLPGAGSGVGGGSNSFSSNSIDISSPQIQTNAIAASSNSNISLNSGSSITSDSQGSHGQAKKPSDGGVASLLSGATSLLLSTATGVGSSPTRNTVLPGSGVGIGVKKAKVKSIYAAWQMRLRVRTYMANLRVNEDLECLSQLSHRAENGGGGNVSVSSTKESTPTPAPVSTTSPPLPTSQPTPPPLPEKSNKSQLPPTPPQLSINSSVMSNTTNTSTISSHRSIFGNQSIEDVRKAIAHQERTSRRRMRMCAVPTYSQHQQYHPSHPQNQYYHQASSSYYQHYLSNGTPGYDPRMAQRLGRYLPPATANAYQLFQLHQQQHQQYRQQQTSAMAAAQWVARQQQLANQQRSKFQSPPHLPSQNQQSMPQQKQSPAYDYALIMKQQQQQMRNAASANFARRSSEPPPRGNVSLPQVITSPSLVHRRPSPQGPQPGGHMQRPPLPSYNEVVAMKQQQAHLLQNPQLQPVRNKDGRPML
ncbi:unnamed protein product, partial [Rodentolepis nana]|uniref:Rap guanine nucleotide exchange factor 2 n=1 Tax=Rodentolepis nana TaxID=102285 RepID=A0A158QGS7_RODNA